MFHKTFFVNMSAGCKLYIAVFVSLPVVSAMKIGHQMQREKLYILRSDVH